MPDEKDVRPEIEHGPLIDRVEPRRPIPCSKRLQEGTRYGWCVRPANHADGCEGKLSEPYDTNKPLYRVDHGVTKR